MVGASRSSLGPVVAIYNANYMDKLTFLGANLFEDKVDIDREGVA